MGSMATSEACGERIAPREVTVRPVRDARERRRWDALASEFHYLPFNGPFGQCLRHVAVRGETWVALVGWTAGAFKVAARDAWIGWTRERQFRRLKLIANNSRFVILGGKGATRNLASRVLGLSLRRLSRDMRAAHGFPVLLAETFVDPSRFAGTCYRASNWRMLGRTRGFTRLPGSPVRWRENGQPKEVHVYELESDARAALSRVEEPAEWRIGAKEAPMPVPQLRSLRDFLEEIPDFRKARGRRYSIACYLTIAVAARLAGYRGVSAFGEFAARLDEEQRKAVGGFWSPTRRRYTVPATSTFHYMLSAMPSDTLDRALRAWSARHGGETPVAMDGKDVRGASKQVGKERRMMVVAVEHGSGLVLGQVQIGAKTNEIPAVRELSRQLDLAGRVVTVDAMHAQHETARCLTEDCEAHYVVTGAKDNQPTIRDDLAFCLTSLGAGEAGPEELLNLVRDFSYDERRSPSRAVAPDPLVHRAAAHPHRRRNLRHRALLLKHPRRHRRSTPRAGLSILANVHAGCLLQLIGFLTNQLPGCIPCERPSQNSQLARARGRA